MNRSGVWYGVALGLMAVAAVGGGASVVGARPDLGGLASLFGFCVGLCWLAEGVLEWVRLWRNDRLNERDRLLTQQERAARLTPPPAPANLSRLVPVNSAGGRSYVDLPAARSARWQKWQLASEEMLVWVRAKYGSILVADTVKRGRQHPFADGAQRKLLLDEWQRQGWCTNQNGYPSELLVTPEEIAQHLARGDVDWPEDVDPPPVKPCPTPDEGVLQNRPIGLKAG
jgi:hypothetical protein